MWKEIQIVEYNFLKVILSKEFVKYGRFVSFFLIKNIHRSMFGRRVALDTNIYLSSAKQAFI